jgi:hypothetical protein
MDDSDLPFGVENLTQAQARQLNQLLDKIRN